MQFPKRRASKTYGNAQYPNLLLLRLRCILYNTYQLFNEDRALLFVN